MNDDDQRKTHNTCSSFLLIRFPAGAQDLSDLGWFHLEQFRESEALSDLEQAIEHFSGAVAQTNDEHPDLAGRLADLGLAYEDRFTRLGELEDEEVSIRHLSRALEVTPDDDPYISDRHSSLGLSYTIRYKRTEELADLEKAIECKTRAVELTPDDHRDISLRHSSLGIAYTDRYHRLGELADLERAVEYQIRAHALTPSDHPNIADRHDSLGVSYGHRYQRLGELADLERALECGTRAIALTPDGHPNMPHRHANLGVSYTDRYWRLGELADLEKAIECDTRSLALTPDGHPNIPRHHANLGISYTDRYRRLSELADLEKAIEYKTRALALTPNGHPDMSIRHDSLGVIYGDRYRRLGELADLETTIEYNTHALALTPNGHPDLPRRHDSVGASYTDRYRHLGELADLEKAIECNTRSLTLTPNGHPDLSHVHTSLGVAYLDRYLRLGELVDLKEAIEHHTRALALTSDSHPDLPIRHYNYALSLLEQYCHSGDLACLTTSLHSFREASQNFIGSPRERFDHALQWADLASKQSLLNPIEAYQTAIDLLPQFIWLGATANQRYQDLSLAENLAVNACFAAIQSLNYSLALEWLEHARCVVWNQSLMLRSPLDQLHSSYPDLATQLRSVANQLNNSSFDNQSIQTAPSDSNTTEKAGQQRRRLAIEYNNLLAQTRQLPGFETFLKPVQAHTLTDAVRDGPVVVINCHKNQCDAVFILPGSQQVGHLTLPNFTEEKAKQAHSDLDLSLRQQRLRERGVRVLGTSGYEDRIESVLSILWTDLVKPILDYLGYANNVPKQRPPHVTWCLTGLLSFLPLHAAGDYTQSQSRIFGYVISSYIPTLSALLTSSPGSLSQSCRVLAVGQATTPHHSPLPGTTKELAHLKAHALNNANYSQLTGSQATTTAVLDAMEQYDWVHLACHTHQNVNDPTKSGFHLHDGTLDLSAIDRRSFKNKGLAFLSACQTATGDEKLPDEAIHLASGMLMAGYPSVIATMWSVVDEDAPLVADRVYAQLMKDGKVGNGAAGRALYYAVGELREKVGEKAFGRWVPYIHIGS
ncbi:aromatic di-alanine and TPR containing protein [Rhizoctonia solani AG-3 Rhs1AP]|uniref:Aromatic di-alanine and TPR containing protein n=2 Tax=Rhizoctonia solani AG-3 TaxID=1086053 RepID=A0A074RR83_9AGAM|nr:aromatic di-alanine and TPR containing protein [Rhizoctonia solani AG-3 Rhs1AP]KEP49581.1 aromatic di-alanine and TPR containing protein [Rhizoctonia solani 123E]